MLPPSGPAGVAPGSSPAAAVPSRTSDVACGVVASPRSGGAATALGAVEDIVPGVAPLFAPGERPAAPLARLGREVRLVPPDPACPAVPVPALPLPAPLRLRRAPRMRRRRGAGAGGQAGPRSPTPCGPRSGEPPPPALDTSCTTHSSAPHSSSKATSGPPGSSGAFGIVDEQSAITETKIPPRSAGALRRLPLSFPPSPSLTPPPQPPLATAFLLHLAVLASALSVTAQATTTPPSRNGRETS